MRTFLTLAIIAGFSSVAFADGNSATATATASVRIVAPVKILSNQNLDFGNIVVDDVDQAAKVTMTSNTSDGMLYSVGTLSHWDKCAPYKKAGTVKAASFHYAYDAGVASTDIGIVIDQKVTLSGGFGPNVILNTNNDLPADACFLIDLGRTDGTQQKHFGVGGTLEIPAKALGTKTGTINVTVTYL